VIRVQNLTKKFGSFLALRDVSFCVNPGEIFALLGPNGAGKSTTIKILTTQSKPTTGQIEIGGLDPVSHPSQVRKIFGIVFQEASLDNELTAMENMLIHGALYRLRRCDSAARTEKLLRLLNLWDRRDQQTKYFSAGMRRRLEVARALLHDPRVLFMDEPTAGLDPQARNHLWEYVKRLNDDYHLTVLLTTHYLEEAERVAHRVAVIDQGKIVLMGSPNGLKLESGAETLEQVFLSHTGIGVRDNE
jgi:ABC-2 type transport system ATP-binding protein